MTTRAPTQPINSIPVVQQSFTLHSLHAIRAYQRVFHNLESNLYLSAVSVRVRGERTRRYAAQIQQVETLIGQFLEETQAWLHSQEQRLAAQLQAARKENLGITYRAPLNAWVQVRTPRAVQLVDLFHALDQLCQRLDTAWFGTLLATDAYLAQCVAATREVTRLAGRVNTLAKGVARHVLGESDYVGGAYAALLQKTTQAEAEISDEPIDDEAVGAQVAETHALVERVEALAKEPAPAAQDAAQDSVLAAQEMEGAGEEVQPNASEKPPEESVAASGEKPGLLRTMFRSA